MQLTQISLVSKVCSHVPESAAYGRLRISAIILISALASASHGAGQKADSLLRTLMNPSLAPFYHGVASADPTSGSVILWTKLTTESQEDEEIIWSIARDSLFQHVLQQGAITAKTANGGCVSVTVNDLQPATSYYYRFQSGMAYSTIGRTRTTPEGSCDRLRFAVVSCAHYEAGLYNAYSHIAARNDLDAVIHLGDYIYEYKAGYSDKNELNRVHLPLHEIITLEDYRMRYSQHRLDPALQAAHARHPFITIWDDHEFANDSHVTGAQNHQPETEGSWEARRKAARQAYFEWLPARQTEEGRLYRSFSFGPLAELWMPDERQEGRTPQATGKNDPGLYSPERSILGEKQYNWLTSGMAASRATWRILGNQVILSSVDTKGVIPGNPKFLDMWDGYPAARERLLGYFEQSGMTNVVVITGDSHTSWAMDLTLDPFDKSHYSRRSCARCSGAEFAAPSITSPNYDEYVPKWKAHAAEYLFTAGRRNPHVHFKDLCHHGYLLLTLDAERANGEWILMKSILRPTEKTRRVNGYYLEHGKPGLQPIH